jgi:hemerythrin superfamily protein
VSTQTQGQAGAEEITALLMAQHQRVKELFADVRASSGTHRKQAFDELRALLAVHETAEEMVLRPVSRAVAGEAVAQARNSEEKEANEVLAQLEDMDVDSPQFTDTFAQFEQAVLDHAAHEETEEFPAVRASRTPEQLASMARAVRAAESIAPTHPHPSTAGSTTAQFVVGPFAALVDRTRDAGSKAMR